MTDDLETVKRQLYEQRELERAMLSRVRGLVVHEYYEPDVEEYSGRVWLKKRIREG